ncbi:MAG: hypothetical protein KGI51_06840 [Rhodospirillales bacterium]|nr:hypothetical protein [Rhodospirillales bacterium]
MARVLGVKVRAWGDGDVPETRQRGGTVLGKARGDVQESRFNERLGKLLDTFDLARKTPAASDIATTAHSTMESALERMGTAAKDKDYPTAEKALTEAEAAANTILTERKKAHDTFWEGFATPRDWLTQALDHTKDVAGIPNPVREAERRAANLRATAEQKADAEDWPEALTALGLFKAAVGPLTEAYAGAVKTKDRQAKDTIGLIDDTANKFTTNQKSSPIGKTAAKEAKRLTPLYDKASKTTPIAAALAALCTVREDARETLAQIGNDGTTAGASELRDRAASAIGKLAKGDPRKALEGRLAEWDKAKLAALKLSDPKAQGKALAGLDDQAQKLLDDALGARGGDQTAARQEAYKAALEKRYGVTIDTSVTVKQMQNKGGKTREVTVKQPIDPAKLQLDRMYDMFGQVPVRDTCHSKLQKLAYTKKGGTAWYGGAEITMGDLGTTDWEFAGYKDGAKAFSVTALHELGHAVDDKYGIMKANQTKTSCGGWSAGNLAIATVAAAFLKDFKAHAGSAVTLDPAKLEEAVTAALSSGTTSRPAGCTDTDWPAVSALLGNCVAIRSDNNPWESGKYHAEFEGVIYQQSYGDGRWSSYSASARAGGTTVRDYQWRAPGEWFAELYGWSWTKKQPISGVDAAVNKYLYRPPR